MMKKDESEKPNIRRRAKRTFKKNYPLMKYRIPLPLARLFVLWGKKQNITSTILGCVNNSKIFILKMFIVVREVSFPIGRKNYGEM